MNEDELRALVREAIARASGASGDAGGRRSARLPRLDVAREPLPLRAAADPDGPCLIEPAVPCNHCGYCQSHGH